MYTHLSNNYALILCHCMYVAQGTLIPGTIVSRRVTCGLSPINCVFNQIIKCNVSTESGIVDSLKGLLMSEHFLKPYSDEHVLASLLLKAF